MKLDSYSIGDKSHVQRLTIGSESQMTELKNALYRSSKQMADSRVKLCRYFALIPTLSPHPLCDFFRSVQYTSSWS